jgi:uncharacterized protein YjbI with pentapeptide repeats
MWVVDAHSEVPNPTLHPTIQSDTTGRNRHHRKNVGMVYAVLTNGDLTGAYLTGSNQSGDNLDNADLTGATLSGVSTSSSTTCVDGLLGPCTY